MKYNLAIKKDNEEARLYLIDLMDKEALIEIKKINSKRSLNQNSYLHLIISAFGNHFGYTLEEAKAIYKELNPTIYKYNKKGRTFWRSSADLDKPEMAATIDKFMEASKEAGYPLPLATNQEWLMSLENEIEKSNYLRR
jgi:hypothetical protein